MNVESAGNERRFRAHTGGGADVSTRRDFRRIGTIMRRRCALVTDKNVRAPLGERYSPSDFLIVPWQPRWAALKEHRPETKLLYSVPTGGSSATWTGV
jgi:hypothetical protein